MHEHFYEDILQILDEAFDQQGKTYKQALESKNADGFGTGIQVCAHLVGHVVDNLLALIQDDDMEFDLEEFNTWVRSRVEEPEV